MKDFEKLGVFYMGREYDLAAKKELPKPVLYPSKDLVTHAVCVGMTGSGKTGLCLTLLEEAAIDGIPALVIDPKGDLANLMLTFPDLKGEDFEPWVNTDDARKKGVSVKDYAKQQADFWKKGLNSWDQLEAEDDEYGGNRLKRLKASADVAIYTPGSNAGIPVSILHSFDAPPEALRGDSELLRERRLESRQRHGLGHADPATAKAAREPRRCARPRDVLPGEGALRPGDVVQQPSRLAELRIVDGRRRTRYSIASLHKRGQTTHRDFLDRPPQ
jgi:hypothetical protein